MKIIILLFLITIFIIGVSLGVYSEYRGFNKGICPRCHKKLRNFNVDSQGGRGYICDNCRYGIWVTYKIVDRKYNNK